jgi:hypothetical protein
MFHYQDPYHFDKITRKVLIPRIQLLVEYIWAHPRMNLHAETNIKVLQYKIPYSKK